MPTKITLDYPVKDKDQAVTSLTMRRMKVRDQVTVSKQGGTNAEQEVRLFANLCEVSTQVIEELDIKDYGKLQETYKGFLS